MIIYSRSFFLKCFTSVMMLYDVSSFASGSVEDVPSPSDITANLIFSAPIRVESQNLWEPYNKAENPWYPGSFELSISAKPLYVRPDASDISKDYYAVLLQHQYMVNGNGDNLKYMEHKAEIRDGDEPIEILVSLPTSSMGTDSTSMTKDWSVSGSVGFFGPVPTINLSEGYSSSVTDTRTTTDVTIINDSMKTIWGDKFNVVIWRYNFVKDSPSASGEYQSNVYWVWKFPVSSRKEDSAGRYYFDYSTNLGIMKDGDPDHWGGGWRGTQRVYLPKDIGSNPFS